MNHLIISREYPPSAYPQGGIGTYVVHVARLLAERGETVHVIGEQWKGAPLDRDVQGEGRLIVHRVPLDRPLPNVADPSLDQQILDAMGKSEFPAQAFSWQVARLAELLVDQTDIDCIEAQDFEAPLYHFLLRRALGLGPRRQPPCFVHLHSPMQFICHHNDWDIGRRGHLTMKRLEDYVVLASDAALCPSRYLGRQVERHYGLAEGSIARIAYPRGDTPLLERTPDTWEHGVIAYFGRMEPRKGVFEWLDAAMSVARERPGLRFELIGSDSPLTGGGGQSVREALAQRIPPDLASSITLLDAMTRPRLFERLANARLAVVPSRWENFPNTCVEAMVTGLPVLASPEGGMAEMLEDGRTGWLARSVTPADLADALRRALDTPADTKAQMGQAAADAIRQLCDNTHTISQQIEFRRELVSRGSDRSRRIPPQDSSVVWDVDGHGSQSSSPLWRGRSEASSVFALRNTPKAHGIAVVIAKGHERELEACRASIAAQTVRPIAVVTDGPNVLSRLLASTPAPRGVVLLDAGCRLDPRFVECADAVLAADESIGVISTWFRTGRKGAPVMSPAPRRPYQWVRDDVGRCAVFRGEALRNVEWVSTIPGAVLRPGDVALAVLLDGWTGVSYPAVLVSCGETRDLMSEALASVGRARLMPRLRARFSDQVAWDAREVLCLSQAHSALPDPPPSPDEIWRMPLPQKLALVRRALGDPAGIARWVLEHGLGALRAGVPRGAARSADKA